MHIKNLTHIHFIGIGGIGMSALAHIAKASGHHVSGCDTNIQQQTVTSLAQRGCLVSSNHGSPLCFDPTITLMVFSTDTQREMVEKNNCLNRNIPVIHRSELLSYFMKDKKIGIAITGAHGKTTTTALTSHIFLTAGLNPTCIIGGIAGGLQSNASYYDKSNFFIAEADESDRSFIILPAAIKVITNIDFEHIDTYSDIDDIKNACLTFLHNFKEKTLCHVVCIDNQHIKELLPQINIPYKTYGTDTNADMQIQNIELGAFHSSFTVYCSETKQSARCTLPIPGAHNILNATAAITTAYIAGIEITQAAATLGTFKGVDRRFTIRGHYNNALVIDDYAHHPEEINKVITTAKHSTKGKLYVIYQPHRFTRTLGLWDDFVHLWQHNNSVDHVFITDIYGAGETITKPISSKELVNCINKSNCEYIENNILTIRQTLSDLCLRNNDTILFLGAGNISQQSIALVKVNEHLI